MYIAMPTNERYSPARKSDRGCDSSEEKLDDATQGVWKGFGAFPFAAVYRANKVHTCFASGCTVIKLQKLKATTSLSRDDGVCQLELAFQLWNE